MNMQLDLLFDDYRVEEHLSARARAIRIEIRSATQVRLVIPRFVSRSVARQFLRERESWVRQKIAEMKLREQQAPRLATPQLRWDGSDRLPLRGRELPLLPVPAQIARPMLRIDQTLSLFCPPHWLSTPERLAQLLRNALKHEALRDAETLLAEEAQRLGLRYSGPRIADQKTLWGSCSASGLISLSWRLVMAPPAVFRYVVVHELCHLRHHDHSGRFWALVAQQMPDFEIHRRWLREQGRQLQHYLPAKP